MADETKRKIVAELFRRASEVGWRNLSDQEHSRLYNKWVDEDGIGGLLRSESMSANQVRTWLKDSVMKEYSRAMYGVGLFKDLVPDPALAVDHLVKRALGDEWRNLSTKPAIKPLRVVVGSQDGEHANFTWGAQRDLKHLVWAALNATARMGKEKWVLCLVESFEAPTPADQKQLDVKIGEQCGWVVTHVRGW
ncbi:hypothetical protein [Actinosynnema sp. NPDC020468]|uniref:hypothetical protein n=1 Tax=Actinosynnema sp. NPDC020468 TaxID=3154488 RepID=UPI0033D4346C